MLQSRQSPECAINYVFSTGGGGGGALQLLQIRWRWMQTLTHVQFIILDGDAQQFGGKTARENRIICTSHQCTRLHERHAHTHTHRDTSTLESRPNYGNCVQRGNKLFYAIWLVSSWDFTPNDDEISIWSKSSAPLHHHTHTHSHNFK